MTANAKLTQLTTALRNMAIEHEIIAHPPIATVEEGLAFLGISAAQGVSTLLFIADGKPVSVMRRDDQKLSFKKIKKHLGVKNLAMASRDQLRSLTGCDIGYVSLYNPGLPPIMDATILEQAYVYGGTGSPEHDLKITPMDLVRFTSASIADVVEAAT
jgi:prolyl-tRNA editing enzyme YbaK/EbsC (Cys-tRNA(Pro) deacylase)